MKVDYVLSSLDLPMFGAFRYTKENYGLLKDKIDLKAIEYDKKLIKMNSLKKYFYDIFSTKKKLRENAICHITTQANAHMLHFIKNKKSVVTCYDLIPYVYLSEEGFLQRLKIKLWMKGLKKANRIIAISEFTKKELVKYLNYPEEKIFIAYCAVDHSNYKVLKRDEKIAKKYKIDSDFFNILYVGNEEKRMNVETIIKSIGELKKLGKKIKFIKVGKANSAGKREKILELIKKLNVEKEVIFTDYVEEEDIPMIYNLVDLCVYPISYAGFGLPPLEAMACGCPVITTNKTSLPEVVGDAAILVKEKDSKDLTKAILKIMEDDKLRKDLIGKGLRQCKKFNWENCAEQFLNCYRSLE